MSEFGNAIIRARRTHMLSQREAARRIGISNVYLGHLESGKRDHISKEIYDRAVSVLGKLPCPFCQSDSPGDEHASPGQPESPCEASQHRSE